MSGINVFVYDWRTVEVTEGKYQTELRMYGKGENHEDVCIRISNVKCTVYLEFLDKDYFNNNENKIKHQLKGLIYDIPSKNSLRTVYKRKLYGASFTEDKFKTFPFIEIRFSSRIGMMSFRKRTKALNFPSEIQFHHDTTSPEVMFMIENDLPGSGWINVKNAVQVLEQKDRKTRCDLEYEAEVKYIKQSPLIKPPILKVLSWDIEAKVNDIKNNPGGHEDDLTFQISAILREGDKTTNYLLSLGPCDDIPGTNLELFNDETEMLKRFASLMKELRPNVITGWNIFNFDFTFLINRAAVKTITSEIMDYGMSIENGQVKKVKWSSKAFATIDINFIDVEGVLNIDLIEAVRKEYKLDSYTLNNVSKHFLNDQKDDLNFSDLLHIFKSYLEKTSDAPELMCKMGKYCVQDSVLVLDLFDHLKTFLGISAMSMVTHTSIMMIHLNGQQKKYFNQIFKYCYRNNIVVQSNAYRTPSNLFCVGAFVRDPTPGIYEDVLPLDFASLYPSIIIAYNLDYTTFVKWDDESIPMDHTSNMEWEDHCGCEHDPFVLEYNQKKEMLVSFENDRKNIKEALKNKKLSKESKEELEKEVSSNQESLKKLRPQLADLVKKIPKRIICQKNRYRWLKQEIYGLGVVPTIIQDLLNARKEVRAQMKFEKDPIQLAILDQRQLSYKISANSMYGATGVRCGALPFLPIAMCTTYNGREGIKKAARIIESLGGSIVYGDTDSNYINLPKIEGTREEQCKYMWDTALDVASKISMQYPKPMKIEFEEKIYSKFMILSKKRYMYYTCKRDGTVSQNIGQKGVLLARRDHSLFVKKTYGKTVIDCFDKKSLDEVMDNIFSRAMNVMLMNIDDEEYKISKSVNDYNEGKAKFNDEEQRYLMGAYKVPTPKDGLVGVEADKFCQNRLPAQVQLEIRMLDRGEQKPEGSRLAFVVCEKVGTKKQAERIEEFTFYQKNKRYNKLDRIYYIERLVDPLEQIVSAVFGKKIVENTLSIFRKKKDVMDELKMLCRPKLIFEN